MTMFNFPDSNSINLEQLNKVNNNLSTNTIFSQLNNNLEINSSIIQKSQLTAYIEDTLFFMQEHNLIPELPKIINIKYINQSLKEELWVNIKNVFGQKPAQYYYPASTNIVDGTIYISNYYSLDFDANNVIAQIRQQFNGNVQQALEYSFFHEIGHLFLIEKTKNQEHFQTNNLFKNLLLNIEEGFAESFAIHMICLKYPYLEKETNHFEIFYKNTIKLSKITAGLFYYKEENLLKTDFVTTLKNLIIKPKNNIEYIFNSYEFPLIYQKSPIKDANNKLITDMNTIFEKCFNIALINNRDVILNKTKYNLVDKFDKNLLTEFQKMMNTKSENLNYIISFFHSIVKAEGFLDQRIKNMRTMYLNQSIKNKI